MDRGGSGPDEQLSEFLAFASGFESEAKAAAETVERTAETLEAEVAAMVADGRLIAAMGYPEGEAPVGELLAAAAGESRLVTVPGAGPRPASVAFLDYPPGGVLLLARSDGDGLSRAETSVLRGIARMASISMRMLHLLEQERERQGLLKAHADAQGALRRVATLVARGVDEQTLLSAVAEEVGRLASADRVEIFRFEPDGTAVRRAATTTTGANLAIGERIQGSGGTVLTLARVTGRPARLDHAAEISNRPASPDNNPGVRSVVGSPIVVENQMWGVVVVSTTRSEPMPQETERQISDFTELVATAVSNAHARAELAASRARVVVASDATRRRIERDLHDGVQQRLVTLALDIREAIDIATPLEPDQRNRLTGIERGLQELLEEIREISRGLHPAILSEAGLRPALKSLARRSPLPVELEVGSPERLPAPVEAAAYYFVSEALTNAVKHAEASVARISVHRSDGKLRIEVSDDGVGGADPARGSGLIGLTDRMEALGGTLIVSSPIGGGTSMVAELPTSG